MSLLSAKEFENNESFILLSHFTLSASNFKMVYEFKLNVSRYLYNVVCMFAFNSTLSWKIYGTIKKGIGHYMITINHKSVQESTGGLGRYYFHCTVFILVQYIHIQVLRSVFVLFHFSQIILQYLQDAWFKKKFQAKA